MIDEGEKLFLRFYRNCEGEDGFVIADSDDYQSFLHFSYTPDGVTIREVAVLVVVCQSSHRTVKQTIQVEMETGDVVTLRRVGDTIAINGNTYVCKPEPIEAC